jgi:putative ATP-dependent endonuclease of the OLD family
VKISALKIRNYRTLEHLDLDFLSSYAAICGANDSGKTNIIRAIRTFMREEDTPFFPSNATQISLKDDYPKWHDNQSSERLIDLSLHISVDKNRDAGLYQFVMRQLNLDNVPDTLDFIVNTSHSSERPEQQVQVSARGKQFSGLEAQEVLKRLQSSESILFHNSTQSDHRTRFHGGLGQLRALSTEHMPLLDTMKKTVAHR